MVLNGSNVPVTSEQLATIAQQRLKHFDAKPQVAPNAGQRNDVVFAPSLVGTTQTNPIRFRVSVPKTQRISLTQPKHDFRRFFIVAAK